MEMIPSNSRPSAASGLVDTGIYTQTIDTGGRDDLIKMSHLYGNFSICFGPNFFAKVIKEMEKIIKGWYLTTKSVVKMSFTPLGRWLKSAQREY